MAHITEHMEGDLFSESPRLVHFLWHLVNLQKACGGTRFQRFNESLGAKVEAERRRGLGGGGVEAEAWRRGFGGGGSEVEVWRRMLGRGFVEDWTGTQKCGYMDV